MGDGVPCYGALEIVGLLLLLEQFLQVKCWFRYVFVFFLCFLLHVSYTQHGICCHAVSVRLSVTLMYCVKTKELIIKQLALD